MNIKNVLANAITLKIDGANFENLIIESISADKGDYSLPCFSFAKVLKVNPASIAAEIQASLSACNIIEKTEVMGGYLNFFLNKEKIAEEILHGFSATDFFTQEGNGKTVLIDYCSPNLAKFLHIGHLKSTITGESLARLFEQCGYTVKRLNFTGDYGTPFGKIIGGLMKWGNIEDVNARGNDALQEYYVKFNQAEAEDESYTQLARDIFKKIEEKDAEIYPLYELVIRIGFKSLTETLDLLGIKFDDNRGEMYYNQLVPQALAELESKGLLKDSQGAKIVELGEEMPPAVIIKSDGTTLYITRDICAGLDRFREYNFDKLIYVTDVSQILHFKQLFATLELMGCDFAKNMEHTAYGRLSLPDGKIASRRGKQAVLVDLLEFAQNKAKEIIADRTFTIENPEDVAKKVARAVLNFSVLKTERIKDGVFDVEKAFSFEGETAPYMQYTFTRLESILRKHKETDVQPNYSCFEENAFELIKYINDFSATIGLAVEKRDASIVGRRVMDMCKAFNKMYTVCKILDGNPETTKAKVNLVKALRDTLKVGFNIMCIDTIKEM